MTYTHNDSWIWRRRLRLSFLSGALLACLALLPVAAQGPAKDDVLVITLRPTTTTREAVVPLGAVATVSGGSPSLRRKVAELDLAELKHGGGVVAVGKEQVSF